MRLTAIVPIILIVTLVCSGVSHLIDAVVHYFPPPPVAELVDLPVDTHYVVPICGHGSIPWNGIPGTCILP